MTKLTSHERIKRMFEHRDADRVPMLDEPWGTTIERWQNEGMPKDVNYVDYFDLDHIGIFGANNSPRYEERVIEETAEYKIFTTSWGVTLRQWKHMTSTPEFIDFTIKDPDSWAKARERITPSRDRIDWAYLEKNYPVWKKQGHWLQAGLWFGFDVTHSWAVGTETMLMAMVETPEWCMDMFSHMLETNIKLLDMVWEAGYHFDSVKWYDDMGYKQNQFFSVDMYRELLKPYHKRAIEWIHSKGAKAHLHSCGDIHPFVPELVGIGLDALNPLEIKAGMDPIKLKKTFGKDLVFHGGINAVLWDHPAQIKAEMEKVIPVMKENGGYIFASDHSIPSSVSFKDFTDIIALYKKLGRY